MQQNWATKIYYNKLTLPFIIQICSLFHAKHPPPLVTTLLHQRFKKARTYRLVAPYFSH